MTFELVAIIVLIFGMVGIFMFGWYKEGLTIEEAKRRLRENG